jgi:hypothetical protein
MTEQELSAALQELMASVCVDTDDVEDEVETAQRAVIW